MKINTAEAVTRYCVTCSDKHEFMKAIMSMPHNWRITASGGPELVIHFEVPGVDTAQVDDWITQATSKGDKHES